MIQCFAYTRVSTVRQGEKGVSLQEQKAAIERYASHNQIEIVEWFEERVSAAKNGRPVFSKMLRRLKNGAADGLVIHKIDRGARNLRDWASLGELIDHGVTVHFANESLDLSSRGGRLTADIQAVVAADYVRNLREETRKGFYGRLRQGLYPLAAPLGYLDRGGGKVKEIDPARGPLIRRAFELYATGRYSLRTLSQELHKLGLQNRSDRRVDVNALSRVLNNPFYTGLIYIKSTGETFEGQHEPLISRALFDAVKRQLQGKNQKGVQVHDFLFRRTFQCELCGRSLTGERQKGHVYYRCHRRDCRTTGFREEALEAAVESVLGRVQLSESERQRTLTCLEALREDAGDPAEQTLQIYQLHLRKADERLTRLTDAFLDGDLDKPTFTERKGLLVEERQRLREGVRDLEERPVDPLDDLREELELASSALLTYQNGSLLHKRELLQRVSSNRTASPDRVAVELQQPFSSIENWASVSYCGPRRDRFRTCAALATRLWQFGMGRLLARRLAKKFGESLG